MYDDIIKQLTNTCCKTQKGLNGPNKDNGYYEIDTRLSSRPGRGGGNRGKPYQGWCFRCGNQGHGIMECTALSYNPEKAEAARAQALRDKASSKERNSARNDNRSSSSPESSHVDSIFIFRKPLARSPSFRSISILRLPTSIVKRNVHVHHADRRFVHLIPPLASYNSKYLRTRTEMRHIAVSNKQNAAIIRAAEGTTKLPHARRRILRALQLKSYDDIQLLPCLSLFCQCPLCLATTSCRNSPGCKCSKCSTFYHLGTWNEAAASVHRSSPRQPTKPYVYSHAADRYLPHLEHPTLRSPTDSSLIRLLQTPLSIHRPPSGAVLDTGCQRPANHDPKQTLQTTNSSYLVKGALGEPMHMAGVIMGYETVDTAGEQLLLVVPGESVFSSKLKESLISVAVLMEAGFDVVFRIPTDAILDEVDPILHPDYGGHITTPDGRQVMMIYFDKTWRLPQRASLQHSRSPPPRYHESLNPFSCLAQHDADNNDADNMAWPQSDTSQHSSDLSEVEQRQFELRQNRQAAVQNLHNSFGHPNNQALLQHCQHAKIGTRYLKRYILSFECAFCQAALGSKVFRFQDRPSVWEARKFLCFSL